jgi:hypothetical protein
MRYTLYKRTMSSLSCIKLRLLLVNYLMIMQA